MSFSDEKKKKRSLWGGEVNTVQTLSHKLLCHLKGRGEKTIKRLAKLYEVSPSKITDWMRELEEKAAQTFEKPIDCIKELKKIESENKRLLQKVGQCKEKK